MAGRIEFLSLITREMLRMAPDARFVFGDNVARRGMGGQAKEMRGEPNAIGVATKRRPEMTAEAFFSDGDPYDFAVLESDIDKVAAAYWEGRLIYMPKAGIGTGLSQMPTRAPKLYGYMVARFAELSIDELPWGKP